MCVRVRVLCKCSRKGRGAMIQVLVCISARRHFSGAHLTEPAVGERREILKFGPKARGGGIEEGGTDPLLMIGASPLLNQAWHTV